MLGFTEKKSLIDRLDRVVFTRPLLNYQLSGTAKTTVDSYGYIEISEKECVYLQSLVGPEKASWIEDIWWGESDEANITKKECGMLIGLIAKDIK